MLKSHIAGQPHRIRPSSPRASISLRTAAQRRSRSASEGVGYSTSLRMALCPRRSRAEVEPMTLVRRPPWLLPARAAAEASWPGLTRASIVFARSLTKLDGCGVKPGNDDLSPAPMRVRGDHSYGRRRRALVRLARSERAPSLAYAWLAKS